jgi:hypothetical protein
MGRNVLIEFRRDTAATWTSVNPTLEAGEPGYETDTGKVKIGDGSTDWNSLGYVGGSSLAVTDGSTTVSPTTEIDFTGATVTDSGGGVAHVSIPGGGGAGSTEIAYAEITSGVNITGTTSGGATTVISPGAITFDGGLVLVEVFSPAILCDTGAVGDLFNCSLFEGSTELGRLAQIRSLSTAIRNAVPMYAAYRFTPSAGSHTYTIRCYVTATTGTPVFNAGAGGTNAYLPAFVRFTKIV